jgi:hypothetical protein
MRIEFSCLNSIISGGYGTRVFTYDHISTTGMMRRAFSSDAVGMHAHPFYVDGGVLASELVYCNGATMYLRQI